MRKMIALAAALVAVAGSACAADTMIPGPGSQSPAIPPTQLAAAEQSASTEVLPVARPNRGNRIVHQRNAGHVCIGGVLCEDFCDSKKQQCTPTRTLTIKLDKPARIDTIQLSAHDNIGETRRSRLVIKVNGREVANTLVYRLGSTLSFHVNATGELITIESAHQYNGFHRGGEEAVVWDVFVFGDDIS